MKPGFFSSEFAVTMAGFAAAFLNKKLGLEIDPSVLMGLLGTVAAYVAQRGWLKTRAPSLVVQPQGLPPFMASAEMSKKMLEDAKAAQ